MRDGQPLQDLTDACRGGYALAAISVYNLEGAQAVAAAAEREKAAVILQAGSSAFRFAGQQPLASVAVAVADSSPARIGVHLDHSRDLAEVQRCLQTGYTSVMIDGSHLPLEDNVDITRQVVRAGHAAGAWVEGELGAVAGDEDRSTETGAASMTDPDEAARFVEATGVDALAVSVGNVHGIPARPVRLDLDRLAAISQKINVPLVLHGASGLPDEEIRQAIALGVAKVNVNTEIRRAYLAALRHCLNTSATDELPHYLAAARAAATESIQDKIRTFRTRPIDHTESR